MATQTEWETMEVGNQLGCDMADAGSQVVWATTDAGTQAVWETAEVETQAAWETAETDTQADWTDGRGSCLSDISLVAKVNRGVKCDLVSQYKVKASARFCYCLAVAFRRLRMASQMVSTHQ